MRLVALLVLLTAALGPAAADTDTGGPRIAIIIDDLGNSLEAGLEAVALPAALTYSVLPQLPYSETIAREAHRHGKEVMLHLPMEAGDQRALGPGGLRRDMDRATFSEVVSSGLRGVPHVAGVNNHMGSLLTREPDAMRWLMQDLRCAGPDIYFVDSRTDVRTVARDLAREAGLANAQRDVFLDNEPDPAYVRSQLERLVAKARRSGSAIGIGHPYPQTLAVLAADLPGLTAQGIRIVPVSRLVEQRRNPESWHACSSPSPTVAKKSKP